MLLLCGRPNKPCHGIRPSVTYWLLTRKQEGLEKNWYERFPGQE